MSFLYRVPFEPVEAALETLSLVQQSSAYGFPKGFRSGGGGRRILRLWGTRDALRPSSVIIPLPRHASIVRYGMNLQALYAPECAPSADY
jgi:hypothetical protein